VPVASILTRGRLLAVVIIIMAVALAGYVSFTGDAAAGTETVTITVGEYSDIVEIRGQIQAVRSTYVTAPFSAGELQILKIAANGTAVKAGDVVAEFDAVTLRRTIQEKQSELRSVKAELQQGQAQSDITMEERQAAVKKAEFEVLKARLALGEIGLIAAIDAERAKLALEDAEQRLHEAQAAVDSAGADARADRRMRESRVEKIGQDLALAERQVAALHVTAPTDGTVNILPNFRSTTPMGTPQEYRTGDRAFPGAIILELPDLSSVYLTARIDEADRGKLATDQSTVIRADAIADRDYQAVVSDISVLARTDFASGWPPPKQFDLRVTLRDPDERLKPGMSATARITVGRLPNALLVPTASIFYEEGRTVVYRLARRGFEATSVDVIRRGREQAAVSGEGLSAGDRIARTRPGVPRATSQP
jgi:multidrug efflux pump subunit AcrA (membrane-fusion protein)